MLAFTHLVITVHITDDYHKEYHCVDVLWQHPYGPNIDIKVLDRKLIYEVLSRKFKNIKIYRVAPSAYF